MPSLSRLFLLDEPASPTRFSLHDVPRTFFDSFPGPSIPLNAGRTKWCKTVQVDGHDVLLVTSDQATTRGG